MSGFASLVTGVVGLAKDLTSSLQVEISHEAYLADDAKGERTYGAPVSYTVVLEHRTRFVRAADLSQQLSKSSIQFLEPVNVKEQDRITLPNGDKPQILSVFGVVNPSGVPYAVQVFF